MDDGCMPDHSIDIIPDSSAPVYPKHASPPPDDQSIWATEDDYRAWNNDSSSEFISNPAKDDGGELPSQPESRPVSEHSSNKKPRGFHQEDSPCCTSSKSKAMGRMFFKTKLCSKLRSGTCPYFTNCSFAHGMEELRRPHSNWPEIVAAEGDGEREEHQIPIPTSSAGMFDGQRSYKGKHCKKFYTDEGCPYGDMCSFLHDEQSKDRESVAINLSPTVGTGGFIDRGYGTGGSGSIQKYSNWKTRICNKWEMTGYCPFGTKCHFAHGAAGELSIKACQEEEYGGHLGIDFYSIPCIARHFPSHTVPSSAAPASRQRQNSLPPSALPCRCCALSTATALPCHCPSAREDPSSHCCRSSPLDDVPGGSPPPSCLFRR